MPKSRSRKYSRRRTTSGGLRGKGPPSSYYTRYPSKQAVSAGMSDSRYFSSRMGVSPETKFLDRVHRKRVQKQNAERGIYPPPKSRGSMKYATRKPDSMSTGKQRSQDVQFGTGGRGGKTMNVLPYKTLVDTLFPILRERKEAYGFTTGSLTSPIGLQGYDQQGFFTQGELQGWYAKSLDAQNLANTTLILPSAQVDWVFMYLGGSITYTITNTCSHTMQIDMLQVKSKRYQNLDPLTRWDTDLVNDGTIRNAQAPIEVTGESRSSLNCRPGQGGRADNSFRIYYQKMGNKRYILEPGQTVYHTIKFPAFKMTGKQINTEISSGVGATQNPKCQYCMIFTRGLGLVCDGADADVNVGATACVITGIVKHQYRASFVSKGYQTYNVNLLPQAAAFATQQEINVETEAQEGYTSFT